MVAIPFSKRMKEILTERDMGIRELQRRSGIGRETIRRRLLQPGYVTREEQGQVADALGVSIDRLLGSDFDTEELMSRSMARVRDITQSDPTLFAELQTLEQVALGSTERGRVLLCIGHYHFRLGQTETALDYFKLARPYIEENEEDLEAHCKLIIAMMFTLYFLNRFHELSALYEESQSIFTTHPEHRANYQHTAAVLHGEKGDLAVADPLFAEALHAYTMQPDLKNTRYLYCNWARYLEKFGRVRDARHCYEKACIEYAKYELPNWVEVWFVVNYLIFLIMEGDFRQAKRIIQQYRPLARKIRQLETKAQFTLLTALVTQDEAAFRDYLALNDPNKKRVWFMRGWLMNQALHKSTKLTECEMATVRALFQAED